MSVIRVSPTPALRRGVAVAAAAALAISGLAFAAPAQAAGETESVTTADIAPDEGTYAGWHQGAANASGRYGVSSEGLKQVGKSQVIRGYDDNSNSELRQGGVNVGVEELIGANYDVTAGQAFFQVPLFIDDDGKNSTAGVFATLRPAVGATSNTTIDGDDLWMVSKNIPDGVDANVPTPLSDLVAVIDERNYKTIGFGTFTDTGDTATVKSITFDGTTYDFTADATETSTVVNADVKGVEAGNYTSWHQGYDDAQARQFVGADGLELDGKSQVMKGFDNNDEDLDVVNASLASVLDDASFTVAAGSDDVSFQIPLRSAAIAGQFTTLYTTTSDSGENELADASWQANKAIGSIPANSERPIEDFVVALGTYKVIGYGVLTSPGTSAVVTNVTFAGTSFTFEDEGPAATSETVRSFAPNEDTFAGWHQGAATNSAAIEAGALHLGAEKSQIIKGYADNSADVSAQNADLNAVLRHASYTVDSGGAFFQVPMFFDDGSATPEFTTLRPSDAADVGENAITLDDAWMSSKTIPGVVDANVSTRLGDILDDLGDYKVLGFGVYSDAGGNGVVKEITWDGVTYTFSDAAPTAGPVTASTTVGKAVKVTLAGAISDGSPLTYSTTTPGATVTGNKLTYTPPSKYIGTKTVAYTVTDDQGATATSDVTVTIKAKTNTKFSISPKKPTSKSKVKLKIEVVATGAIVKGTKVTIYDGSKKLGTATLNSGKRANFTVGKLKKGTHHLRVSFPGNSQATANDQIHTVKVKK